MRHEVFCPVQPWQNDFLKVKNKEIISGNAILFLVLDIEKTF